MDEARVQDYVDGHRAGYAIGFSDGRGTGFGEAKARVYASISAYEDAGARVPKPLLDAIRATLGSTPS